MNADRTGYRVIEIPVHPDEEDIPESTVYIALSKGRYAIIKGPLGYHTLTALQGTLQACKPCLVRDTEDYSI
jgi:hypothetical protein